MKVTNYSGNRVRQILVGMIMSDTVIGHITAKWEKGGLFKEADANLIGGWCVDYYKKFRKAPKKAIAALFGAWAEQQGERGRTRSIEKLLASLSLQNSGKGINHTLIVDYAGKEFDAVKLAKLRDEIDNGLELGNLDDVISKVTKFNKIQLGAGSIIEAFQDQESWKRVMENRPESIIKFPGDLGTFFGHAFARDRFVAIMGPMKRAKSFFLSDIAYRAMIQRRKVLYFQVGDLTEEQQLERFLVRMANRPMAACTVYKPTKLEKVGSGGNYSLGHEEMVYQNGLSIKALNKAKKRMVLNHLKSNESYLKLSTHATKTLSIYGVRSIVDQVTFGGHWIPDVIAIDYLDILTPAPGFSESRDAVNENWAQSKRLSQELHCTMLTVTQTNAASFHAENLDMNNFAEDNRKFAHVDGMLGLNQNADEKEHQIWRLTWQVLRHQRYSIRHQIHVAGCLELANPMIVSSFL